MRLRSNPPACCAMEFRFPRSGPRICGNGTPGGTSIPVVSSNVKWGSSRFVTSRPTWEGLSNFVGGAIDTRRGRRTDTLRTGAGHDSVGRDQDDRYFSPKSLAQQTWTSLASILGVFKIDGGDRLYAAV